jgi:hypothetical protein
VNMNVSEIPERVAKFAKDYVILNMYLDTVEESGSTDLVVLIDLADDDNVEIGLRSDMIASLMASDFVPEVQNVLAAMNKPAAEAASTPMGYWLLAKDADGIHCMAIGTQSQKKSSV